MLIFDGDGYLDQNTITLINTIFTSIERLVNSDFPDYQLSSSGELLWQPAVEGGL